MNTTLLRLATAPVAGAAMAAAFPPLGFSPLILLGAIALIAACWRASLRVAAVVGLIAGVVFFAALLSWMTIVGVDAWIGLSVVCALWWMLAACGTALASRLPFPPLWIAGIWVAEEALRDRIPFGGFPWGRFGFATVGTGLDFAAAIGGVPLLTALVIGLSASVVWVFAERRRSSVITLITVVAIGVACAAAGYVTAVVPTDGERSVAAVQGSVPEYGMGAMDTRRRVLENHIRQTLKLAESGSAVDIVIWPENASDIDPLRDASASSAITATATAVNAPMLVGAVVESEEDPRFRLNVGIVWTDAGPGEMYVKTHPVPFGEYIPFRAQLATLTDRFDRIPSDFAAGNRPGNLPIAGTNLGDVICFEVAYDAVVRDVVLGGASFIAVQTNNATYGATGQPAQQLAITRLRAIEHGRWIAVAATSGVSAFINPHGEVVQQLTDNVPGYLLQQVPLATQLTIADRIGVWLEWALALLGVIAVAYGLVIRGRKNNVRLRA